MDRSKEVVAVRLAQAHFSVEPVIAHIFRLLADDERESDPSEPVKLLEVNPETTADGVRPVFFGPHNASGIFYPSVIVEVTPGEFEQIRGGELKLPNNWRLGPEMPRGVASAVGAGGGR
jgi:hypothetical protein